MRLLLCRGIFLVAIMGCCGGFVDKLSAQKLALKTNALTWATLSPNLGAEIIVGSHISVNAHFTYRPFDFKGEPFKFFVFQPEVRYWLGRPCSRHFIGITGFYLDNNMVLKDTHYRGDGVAGGFTYGYNWVLSKHWNFELTAGAGVMYTRQFKYPKGTDRPLEVNYEKWLPVPMKLAASFVYIFK